MAFLPLLAALPGGLAGLVSLAHLPHLLLAVVVAVIAAGLVVEQARGSAPGWTQVAIAGVLLFSLPINAHAWGLGPVAVAADWIHLVAASVWIGGLPCLLALLRRTKGERSHVYATVVPRFSRLAGWSLAVLVATGAYLALLQVPNPEALRETLYGQSLAFKIVLVAGLALLGALNRFLFLPRLRRETRAPAVRSRFVASLRAEVVLGAAVLLAVAVLTITPPARTVQQQAAGQPLALAGIAGDFRVGLEISPGAPGRNRFEVLVRDPLDHPVEMDRVVLRLRKIDGDTGPVTVLLARTDAGAYAAESGDLALPGYWEIEVALSRTGRPDAVTSFPFVAGPLRLDSHPDAVRLLRLAGRATEELRTWRETEQLTDGTSGVVLTRYAFQRPDRVRIESADGTTVILIAATRYVRPPGGLWTRDSLPERFAARGPAAYMQGVQRAALGREDRCPEETCRVVLWKTADGAASMAAWIGMRTFRVHRLLMVAQGHYMTSRIANFNAPLRVEAPE
jgi:putative copper export protein